MAGVGYVHKPDSEKKKMGRPRKYVGVTQGKPNIKKKFKERVVVEPYNNSKPLVELDYYTFEYVDTYPSIEAYCRDYGINVKTVSQRLNYNKNGIVILPILEKIVVLEEIYYKMKEVIR